jgi:hypothetical protein
MTTDRTIYLEAPRDAIDMDPTMTVIAYGARQLGYRVASFSSPFPGSEPAPLPGGDIFIGQGVAGMRAIFRGARIAPRPMYDLPTGLEVSEGIHGNRFDRIPLSAAYKRYDGGRSFFIKPVLNKLFTGFVADPALLGPTGLYDNTAHVDEDATVLVCRPFPSPIAAEWRVIVHDGNIIGIAQYRGSWHIERPANRIIEGVVCYLENANRSLAGGRWAPVAYSVDLAKLEDGSTAVVECNDMWALGDYGIDPCRYVAALVDRYDQLVKERR